SFSRFTGWFILQRLTGSAFTFILQNHVVCPTLLLKIANSNAMPNTIFFMIIYILKNTLYSAR
ncbi:MAG TPA: hypothetical protein VHO90_10035, partial [Bacteroidales bacterium]|nr:hypothetical protein [Bacteroidales bacterium]